MGQIYFGDMPAKWVRFTSALTAITARGAIISKSEAALVESTLTNAELAKLLGARANELSTMLAKWQTGGPCD